jgi:phosphatidyl-myo-inositol dimannoside synthase
MKTGTRTPIKVLSIGHSYAIALNRAILRELARDRSFAITVGAPRVLDGDLRRTACEPEPARSRLRMVALDATFTGYVNLLGYDAVQLARLIESDAFDIVFAWVEPWTLAARQIVDALGRRAVRFCFWTFQNLPRKYPRPFAAIEKRVVARADLWIAGTDAIRQVQIARGYPSRRARVLPHAVDATRFRPSASRTRQAMLRTLNLRAPVIGFAGRLVEEKGLDIVMAAVERLDASLPWSVLIMGAGPYETIVKSWARRRGRAARVRIRLLKHDDVPRYLAAVDLLLVPSQTRAHWREQFGRVVIEAFAAGVPVIASDSGALPYCAGNAARVIAEGDVAAWSHALDALLRDVGARRALARRGRARARQFSAPVVAADLGRIFRALHQKGGRGYRPAVTKDE